MAAPVKVSSLIKISRYAFLGAGIFYGISRQALNQMTEDSYRAQVEKERPAKEAAAKAEKEKLNKEEMAYLAKETGAGGGGGGSGGGSEGGSTSGRDGGESSSGCSRCGN